MLQCTAIVPWVFKERISRKAVSLLFPDLIHMYGYQLEHHPRDQYPEYPPPQLVEVSETPLSNPLVGNYLLRLSHTICFTSISVKLVFL